jgi:glycosyltransferase involved in cell wall biosynthesis
VAAGAAKLRQAGFRPDVICAHIGWGEALFLKDVFPEAKLLLYCEFFYRSRGADMGFDPEFPTTAEKLLRLRIMNAPLLMSLDAADHGMVPTRWQHYQFPAIHKPRIAVIHDGIDTDVVAPAGEPDAELITYVARNLEPYRGFHSFMRAIPEIQRRRRQARIVIVGGDEVSYSPLPAGQTYRQRLLAELGDRIDLTGSTSAARFRTPITSRCSGGRQCTSISRTRSCFPGRCSRPCPPAVSSSVRAPRRWRR